MREWWSCGRAPDWQSRDSGSSAAVLKLRQFRAPHICLCLSEETLKASGPFYLVSVPGEVKDSTQEVNVYPVVDSLILEKDNSENQ